MVKKTVTFILTLIVLSIHSFAEDVEIVSSVNKSKIYLNEQLVLTLTIKGADKDLYKSIELPDLKENFSIISTSQSSSFSFVNGVANRTRQYRYSMMPNQSGIFIIDPIKVSYKGTQLSTKPIRVVVRNATVNTPASNVSSNQVQQQAVQQEQSQSIFLETQISTNNIFIGESIDYSIKLYRRISLWSSISINQEDLQDVWQTTFETAPEKVVRKNSQRYYELELVKKKIRPLTPGELSIPPLTARFVVDPFSGEYQLISDVVTINVQALPDPKPLSFTGAIGTYNMTVSNPVLANDNTSFQIQIKIDGVGSLSELSAPIIPDTPEYRVLSAPQKNEDFISTYIFDYVIIPKSSGLLTIPPIQFSFFSRDLMDYITLESEPFELNVELNSENSVEQSVINEDIQFLKENTILNSIKTLSSKPKTVNALIVLNALIAIWTVLFVFKHKIKLNAPNEFNSRRKVIQQVQAINQNLSNVEMQKILVLVLNNFTNYSKNTLESNAIEKSLIHAELSDPIIKGMMQWIKTSQKIQFSKEKSVDQSHSSSDSLKRILNEVIKEVKR